MPAPRQRCRIPRRRDQTTFESLEHRVVLAASHVGEIMLGLQSGSGDAHPSIGQANSGQPSIGQPAQLSEAQDGRSLRDIHKITGVDVAQAEYGLSGEGQTVVIIDSGVAYDHLALGDGFGPGYRVVGGWDFTEEQDADPYDDGPAGFHGTHVAGIVASSDSEHTGVAPAVDVVALRVFNDQGRGKLSWLESSLEWVIDNVDSYEHPITTVNLSIGTNWNDTTLPDYAKLEDEFARLESMGIFVAVAAGNRFDSEQPGLSYPASSPHVVPIASSTLRDGLSDFSQRSDNVMVAPGENIVSSVPDYLFDFNGIGDDFYSASGTSMAAPYLAGASILVREALQRSDERFDERFVVESEYGQNSLEVIRNVLFATADLIRDTETGQDYRRVNVEAAVELILGDSTESSSPTIHQHDGVLTVYGTNAADEIQVDQFGTVRVNDELLRFSPHEVTSIQLNGNGGDDRLSIKSRFDASQISLSPGEVRIRGESKLFAEGFLRIEVKALGDRTEVEFTGQTNAQDDFVIKPTHSWMESGEYLNYIRGATLINSHATGETDTVTFFDSPENDSLIVHAGNHSEASMTALRTVSTYAKTVGYSQVVVRANQGGRDQATIVGSRGSDVVRSKPNYGSLKNENFFVYAQGFDRMQFVGGGGQDSAKVYDSSGRDRLVMDGSSQAMVRPQSVSSLSGFDRVEAFASAGHDIVEFNGSRLDESFTAKSTHAWMEVDDRVNYARGFDRVVINGGGGADSARLYGAASKDQFLLRPSAANVVGAYFQYDVRDVSWLHAFSSGGGDEIEVRDHRLTDELFANSRGVWVKGENYTTIAEGFTKFSSSSDSDALPRILDEILLDPLE